jgi:murein DD-endopeptidase MepM/ murein hydrolase activator NlpD
MGGAEILSMSKFFRRIAGWQIWGLGLLLLLAAFSFPTTAQITTSSKSSALPTLSHLAADLDLAQASPSIDDLKRQQQQLERQRSQINQQQQQLENQQDTAEDRLQGLQGQIQTTNERIAYNEQQLATANQRLKQLQADLAKAEAAYQQQQLATVARLRFLQRQQSSRGWAVLLQSENLNEFLDRRYQFRLIYDSDRQILAQLKTQTDEINRRRRNVEEVKNQIALLTQELQAQKAQFQAQAKTQQVLIQRLKDDRQALEAAETQLDQDSSKLTQLIRERIAAQERNRIVIRGTGRFSSPSGGYLTSSFGYRIHPILGYRRFHAGIDFGASHGSPIRSADAGRVIFAGWYGGYGQSIIIDHGDNLTTLYAHASDIYVSEGQTVQRGQAIAAIGSTGLSTGPHLHFEVRVNGEPVNPLAYL